ncbi:hypothetical protein CANMA_005254 [Candida margitis]|uniref:uncharacterized protein n=1 Tax=Candida margitis TaxID=1775924 RepID=UPI0022273FBD|nr:uncharacterized protein CANMA_005254 [Candida margitis]KAI5950594.1 hypothetical protein CANMA_005254 [Candida margitis]
MFRRRKSQHQSKQEVPKEELSRLQQETTQAHQQQPQQQTHRSNYEASTKSKLLSSSSQSTSSTATRRGSSNVSPREYNIELLHTGDKKEPAEIQHTYTSATNETNDSDDCLSPLTSGTDGREASDTQSMALSETDTLCAARKQRLELQDVYIDNFSMYLPFLVRQLRLAENRAQDEDRRRRQARARAGRGGPPLDHFDEDYDAENDTIADDDLSTIFNDSQSPEEQYEIDNQRIMHRKLSAYNYKRSVVFVGCSLKSGVFIFPTAASFKLFKQLRSNIKQERKSSMIVYDADGNIKKVTSSNGINRSEFTKPGEGNDEVVDDRNHIIPVSYKIKGQGLPLLKMHSPYMSTFRKNTPYLIFKKFKEVPSPPKPGDPKQNDVDFETFDYCYVYSKYSSNYRRFIFEFFPNTASCFKVVMFESSFKPFADFNYKGTRFRVIGTTISTGLVCEYNPHMRLLAIDDDQPSLCDGIVNKKSSSGFMKLKKSSNEGSSSHVEFNINDPTTFINPIPNSKFLNSDGFSDYCQRATFIPNNLPPFGCYKDVNLYKPENVSFIPKKYSEIGKSEIYQDLQSLSLSSPAAATRNNEQQQYTSKELLNSTLSVDQDTLVITVLLSTLREVNVKNANKSTGNPTGRTGVGVMGSANFGFMTTGLSTI